MTGLARGAPVLLSKGSRDRMSTLEALAHPPVEDQPG